MSTPHRFSSSKTVPYDVSKQSNPQNILQFDDENTDINTSLNNNDSMKFAKALNLPSRASSTLSVGLQHHPSSNNPYLLSHQKSVFQSPMMSSPMNKMPNIDIDTTNNNFSTSRHSMESLYGHASGSSPKNFTKNKATYETSTGITLQTSSPASRCLFDQDQLVIENALLQLSRLSLASDVSSSVSSSATVSRVASSITTAEESSQQSRSLSMRHQLTSPSTASTMASSTRHFPPQCHSILKTTSAIRTVSSSPSQILTSHAEILPSSNERAVHLSNENIPPVNHRSTSSFSLASSPRISSLPIATSRCTMSPECFPNCDSEPQTETTESSRIPNSEPPSHSMTQPLTQTSCLSTSTVTRSLSAISTNEDSTHNFPHHTNHHYHHRSKKRVRFSTSQTFLQSSQQHHRSFPKTASQVEPQRLSSIATTSHVSPNQTSAAIINTETNISEDVLALLSDSSQLEDGDENAYVQLIPLPPVSLPLDTSFNMDQGDMSMDVIAPATFEDQDHSIDRHHRAQFDVSDGTTFQRRVAQALIRKRPLYANTHSASSSPTTSSSSSSSSVQFAVFSTPIHCEDEKKPLLKRVPTITHRGKTIHPKATARRKMIDSPISTVSDEDGMIKCQFPSLGVQQQPQHHSAMCFDAAKHHNVMVHAVKLDIPHIHESNVLKRPFETTDKQLVQGSFSTIENKKLRHKYESNGHSAPFSAGLVQPNSAPHRHQQQAPLLPTIILPSQGVADQVQVPSHQQQQLLKNSQQSHHNLQFPASIPSISSSSFSHYGDTAPGYISSPSVFGQSSTEGMEQTPPTMRYHQTNTYLSSLNNESIQEGLQHQQYQQQHPSDQFRGPNPAHYPPHQNSPKLKIDESQNPTQHLIPGAIQKPTQHLVPTQHVTPSAAHINAPPALSVELYNMAQLYKNTGCKEDSSLETASTAYQHYIQTLTSYCNKTHRQPHFPKLSFQTLNASLSTYDILPSGPESAVHNPFNVSFEQIKSLLLAFMSPFVEEAWLKYQANDTFSSVSSVQNKINNQSSKPFDIFAPQQTNCIPKPQSSKEIRSTFQQENHEPAIIPISLPVNLISIFQSSPFLVFWFLFTHPLTIQTYLNTVACLAFSQLQLCPIEPDENMLHRQVHQPSPIFVVMIDTSQWPHIWQSEISSEASSDLTSLLSSDNSQIETTLGLLYKTYQNILCSSQQHLVRNIPQIPSSWLLYNQQSQIRANDSQQLHIERVNGLVGVIDHICPWIFSSCPFPNTFTVPSHGSAQCSSHSFPPGASPLHVATQFISIIPCSNHFKSSGLLPTNLNAHGQSFATMNSNASTQTITAVLCVYSYSSSDLAKQCNSLTFSRGQRVYLVGFLSFVSAYACWTSQLPTTTVNLNGGSLDQTKKKTASRAAVRKQISTPLSFCTSSLANMHDQTCAVAPLCGGSRSNYLVSHPTFNEPQNNLSGQELTSLYEQHLGRGWHPAASLANIVAPMSKFPTDMLKFTNNLYLDVISISPTCDELLYPTLDFVTFDMFSLTFEDCVELRVPLEPVSIKNQNLLKLSSGNHHTSSIFDEDDDDNDMNELHGQKFNSIPLPDELSTCDTSVFTQLMKITTSFGLPQTSTASKQHSHIKAQLFLLLSLCSLPGLFCTSNDASNMINLLFVHTNQDTIISHLVEYASHRDFGPIFRTGDVFSEILAPGSSLVPPAQSFVSETSHNYSSLKATVAQKDQHQNDCQVTPLSWAPTGSISLWHLPTSTSTSSSNIHLETVLSPQPHWITASHNPFSTSAKFNGMSTLRIEQTCPFFLMREIGGSELILFSTGNPVTESSRVFCSEVLFSPDSTSLMTSGALITDITSKMSYQYITVAHLPQPSTRTNCHSATSSHLDTPHILALHAMAPYLSSFLRENHSLYTLHISFVIRIRTARLLQCTFLHQSSQLIEMYVQSALPFVTAAVDSQNNTSISMVFSSAPLPAFQQTSTQSAAQNHIVQKHRQKLYDILIKLTLSISRLCLSNECLHEHVTIAIMLWEESVMANHYMCNVQLYATQSALNALTSSSSLVPTLDTDFQTAVPAMNQRLFTDTTLCTCLEYNPANNNNQFGILTLAQNLLAADRSSSLTPASALAHVFADSYSRILTFCGFDLSSRRQGNEF